MSKSKSDLIFFYGSLVCFGLLATVFLLMPMKVSEENYPTFIVVLGGFLWLTAILGIVMQIMVSIRCKKWVKANNLQGKYGAFKKLGVFSFAKNIAGLVSDIVLGVSLIVFALLMIFTDRDGFIGFLLMALIVFSFAGHCIFNGKNYCFIKDRK